MIQPKRRPCASDTLPLDGPELELRCTSLRSSALNRESGWMETVANDESACYPTTRNPRRETASARYAAADSAIRIMAVASALR